MLCPLKFNRDLDKGLSDPACEKEKCAWWVRNTIKTHTGVIDESNGMHEQVTEINECCAIKLIAEK